jgi:hypothetical protein
MKKNKFSKKLSFHKSVVSHLKSNDIVGGGPTWQVTCAYDCVSLNAKNYPCEQPIYTEGCPGSLGCEPYSAAGC